MLTELLIAALPIGQLAFDTAIYRPRYFKSTMVRTMINES